MCATCVNLQNNCTSNKTRQVIWKMTKLNRQIRLSTVSESNPNLKKTKNKKTKQDVVTVIKKKKNSVSCDKHI